MTTALKACLRSPMLAIGIDIEASSSSGRRRAKRWRRDPRIHSVRLEQPTQRCRAKRPNGSEQLLSGPIVPSQMSESDSTVVRERSRWPHARRLSSSRRTGDRGLGEAETERGLPSNETEAPGREPQARSIGTTESGLVLRLPGATRFFALGKFPVRPREMAGIAVRIALEIVLVLRLGLPEIAGRRHFGHHLAWP